MDPELWEKLKERAEILTISYSSAVRLAIGEYLQEKNKNGNQKENKTYNV